MAREIYDRRFYDDQSQASSRSAEAVVPFVIDLIHPKSVVDVGCGLGTWLAVFLQNRAVEDVLGIDGPYVDKTRLYIPERNFVCMDLSNLSHLERQFDLALCLEVLEHIPQRDEGALIDFLVTLAPVVLFSAAVPGQGGAGHVNEQWPDYWSNLFADRGYRIFDVIRPQIWGLAQIEPWYRQNSFIFVRESAVDRYASLQANPLDASRPLSLVHPELFRRFSTLEYVQSRQMVYELVARLRTRFFQLLSGRF